MVDNSPVLAPAPPPTSQDQDPYALPDTFQAGVVGAPTVSDAQAHSMDFMNSLTDSMTSAMSAKTNSAVNLLNQSNAASQQLVNQAQVQRDAIVAANTKKEELARYPKFVTRILGTFDSDWNPQHYDTQIENAKVGLMSSAAAIDGLQSSTQMNMQVLQQQQEMIKDQFTAQSGKITQALDLRKQMEQESQYNTQLMFQQRADKRAAAGEARATTDFQQQQFAHKLNNMSDQELDAALGGSNPDVNKFQAREEQLRRATEVLQVHSIQNSVESGDIQLADVKKQQLLTQQNPLTLAAIRDQAEKNGGTTQFHGIDVTTRELDGAISTAAGEQASRAKAAADIAGAQDDISSNLDSAHTAIVGMTQAFGTDLNVSPIADKYLKATREIATRAKFGDIATAKSTSDALLAEVNKFQEDSIKAYPAEQQPFLRKRINGAPVTTQDALQFIGVSALDRSAMGGVDAQGNAIPGGGIDSKYSGAFGAFQGQVSKDLINSGLDASGNIDATAILASAAAKGVKFDEVAANAFSKTNPLPTWMAHRDTQAWSDALTDMAKLNPQVFAGLDINTFIRQTNAGGGKGQASFDSSLLLSALQQKYDKELSTGKFGQGHLPPTSYATQLTQYMQSNMFQQKVYNYWMSGLSPNGYAFAEMLHKGNPLIGYQASMAKANERFQQYQAQLQQQAIQTSAQLGIAGGRGPIPQPRQPGIQPTFGGGQ